MSVHVELVGDNVPLTVSSTPLQPGSDGIAWKSHEIIFTAHQSVQLRGLENEAALTGGDPPSLIVEGSSCGVGSSPNDIPCSTIGRPRIALEPSESSRQQLRLLRNQAGMAELKRGKYRVEIPVSFSDGTDERTARLMVEYTIDDL